MRDHRHGTRPTGITMLLVAILLAGWTVPAAAAKDRGARNTAPERVWPLPPELPRIRYLTSYRTSKDFEKKKKGRWRRLLLGQPPDQGFQLKKPYGVTTDPEGRVYVTDTGLGAVVVFDPRERNVYRLGSGEAGPLTTPIGIAVDHQGRIFVADADLDRVFVFDGDGRVLLALGKAEGLQNPTGLAIDEKRQRLYVVDSQLHRIYVYSTDGTFVESRGSRGSDDGMFNYPTNVALDARGNLYVVDMGNFRVQIFSPDGTFLSKFGEAGDGFGRFHRPKGIALDSEGHIYVVDAAFNNFQIFDGGGTLLLFVGSLGRQPGDFWLPAGMHIDSQDRIYVVDQINARVQIFQYMNEEMAVAYTRNKKGDARGATPPRPSGPSDGERR